MPPRRAAAAAATVSDPADEPKPTSTSTSTSTTTRSTRTRSSLLPSSTSTSNLNNKNNTDSPTPAPRSSRTAAATSLRLPSSGSTRTLTSTRNPSSTSTRISSNSTSASPSNSNTPTSSTRTRVGTATATATATRRSSSSATPSPNTKPTQRVSTTLNNPTKRAPISGASRSSNVSTPPIPSSKRVAGNVAGKSAIGASKAVRKATEVAQEGDQTVIKETGNVDQEEGDETAGTVVVHSEAEEEEEEESDEDKEGDETTTTISNTQQQGVTSSNAQTPPSKPVSLPTIDDSRQVRTPTSTQSAIPSSSQPTSLSLPKRTPSNINSNYVPQTPVTSQSQSQIPGTSQSNLNGNGNTVIISNEPRLVLHKLVLHNFKSYAGSQTIGPFHKSFSSVVGPNGSGKSNVIDALLFVFGWRAKTMRQGKLGELIHNSEKGGLNIKECSVEVWFREIIDLPGDAFKVVPNSRLIVSRAAYKNNSSNYFLNSKKSNYSEVTTLLKGRGIDLDHKRFLILQGEVESIAQMPPKAKNEHEEGLLEYLEDIIGTSKFKVPIGEAIKKVDELNEQRGMRLARLKITQREKDSLEGKKREAESYLKDQNELAKRQSALWQCYGLECRDQLEVAKESLEKLNGRIEEEREKFKGSKEEIEELEKNYKELKKSYEKLEKENEGIIKTLAGLEKEEVQLGEKKKHLETKRKKIEKSLGEDKHALSSARSTNTNSTAEIAKVTWEQTKLESQLESEEAELEKIRDGLKDKTSAFSSAIEKKQVELEPWVAKKTLSCNKRDVAKEERDLLKSREESGERLVEEAKEALKSLKESNDEKKEELKNLQSESENLKENLIGTQEELNELLIKEKELRSLASSARSKADEAKSSASASRSKGDVLSGLTRQSELGLINGFHGRLGNLGVIDDKYDVAISTACPGLDSIVVESVENGQACIEHLRKNNLGRANFILLNSLSKVNLDKIQTPENVPRLFDLVKPKDDKFRPAFYHQLRDTLVANDLNHANRIAYGGNQRWRVVTLDGQLIDKSGTMSGGGNKVSRGGMSSKFSNDESFSPEQLAKLEKEVENLESKLLNHRNEIKKKEKQLEEEKSRGPEIKESIDKLKMDLVVGENRLKESEKSLKVLQSESKVDLNDEKRIKELEKILETEEVQLGELNEKITEIQDEIRDLSEKILEVGGVKLRSQKTKVDDIREMLDLGNERIMKAEVSKNKSSKDVVRLETSLEKLKKDLESSEKELEDLKEILEEKKEKTDQVREKVRKANDVMEVKMEERDSIKAELDERSEESNKFRALEMEMKQKIEENQRSIAQNEQRLKHWQEKRAQLELHRIDEDSDDSDDEDDEEDEDQEQGSSKGKEKEKSAEEGEDQVHGGDEDSESKSKKKKKGKKNSGAEGEGDESDASDKDEGNPELEEYPDDEVRAFDKESIKAEIVVFEEKVSKGSGNLTVLVEYKKRENEFLNRAKDLEETTKERDQAKNLHDDLRKQRLESFMAGFGIISSKLKEMYQTITLGGNAELELVDSLDPFSEGIIFSVMPPKKSWKNISNLSGGEKTLSSLALVFALHVFKPTPLYVMDEIDAALDFRNVSIVANLIKERTKNAQFVVISLRNNMFELASRLVGIYKTNSMTKSITIDNSDLPQPPALTPSTPGGQSLISATPGSRRFPPGSQQSMRSSQVPSSSMSQRFIGSNVNRNPSSTPSQGRVPSTPSSSKTPLVPSSRSTSNGSTYHQSNVNATPSAAALASAQKAKRAIAALCTPGPTLNEEDEENDEEQSTPTLLRKGPVNGRLAGLTSRKS